jgi:hypothetical protein
MYVVTVDVRTCVAFNESRNSSIYCDSSKKHTRRGHYHIIILVYADTHVTHATRETHKRHFTTTFDWFRDSSALRYR